MPRFGVEPEDLHFVFLTSSHMLLMLSDQRPHSEEPCSVSCSYLLTHQAFPRKGQTPGSCLLLLVSSGSPEGPLYTIPPGLCEAYLVSSAWEDLNTCSLLCNR